MRKIYFDDAYSSTTRIISKYKVTDFYKTISGETGYWSFSVEDFLRRFENQCVIVGKDFGFSEEKIRDAIQNYWDNPDVEIKIYHQNCSFTFSKELCFSNESAESLFNLV